MKDIDHKLSREIINTAKAHDVSVIKIRATTKHPLNDKNKSKNNIIACIHGHSIDLHSL